MNLIDELNAFAQKVTDLELRAKLAEAGKVASDKRAEEAERKLREADAGFWVTADDLIAANKRAEDLEATIATIAAALAGKTAAPVEIVAEATATAIPPATINGFPADVLDRLAEEALVVIAKKNGWRGFDMISKITGYDNKAALKAALKLLEERTQIERRYDGPGRNSYRIAATATVSEYPANEPAKSVFEYTDDHQAILEGLTCEFQTVLELHKSAKAHGFSKGDQTVRNYMVRDIMPFADKRGTIVQRDADNVIDDIKTLAWRLLNKADDDKPDMEAEWMAKIDKEAFGDDVSASTTDGLADLKAAIEKVNGSQMMDDFTEIVRIIPSSCLA